MEPTTSSAAAPAAVSPSTPSWFIADAQCNTIADKKAEAARAGHLEQLQSVFPSAEPEVLARELSSGADVDVIANRLLSGVAARV